MIVVLLRGLAREAGHWGTFHEQFRLALSLSNHEETVNVLTPDLPGCGIHYKLSAASSIESMTDFVREQVFSSNDGNLTKRSITLIGLSMGGLIALDWAQRFPEEIRYIAMINSSLGNQPISWRLSPRSWPSVVKALLSSTNVREKTILRQVSNERDAQRLSEPLWLDIQKRHPVKRITILKMLWAAANFKPSQSRIGEQQTHQHIKGMVIGSRRDKLVSFSASNDISKQLDWPIISHPTAGHDLPMDAPTWLCNVLVNWLLPSMPSNKAA